MTSPVVKIKIEKREEIPSSLVDVIDYNDFSSIPRNIFLTYITAQSGLKTKREAEADLTVMACLASKLF